jgi:hypothetical protein
MARSHARLQFDIWRGGLGGLGPNEKLLYCVLLTEPTLNHCGIGAMRVSRWAKDASLTMEETEKALRHLSDGAYVYVDEDTEEVFVRTLIRNDGVADQPYVLKGALREALLASSPRIRKALAGELRKLPPRQPDGLSKTGRKVTYPDPHATADVLDPPPPGSKATRKAPETLFEGAENPSESPLGGGGGGGGGISSPVGTSVTDTLSSENPPREDVDRLCEHLADLVESNTAKRPNITQRWRDSARLLLDKDLAKEPDPLALAMRLADWATADEFWRTNILSMPTFREKFDRLRLKARSEWERNRGHKRTTDDKRADISGLVAEVYGTAGSSALRPDTRPDHLRAIQGGNS